MENFKTLISGFLGLVILVRWALVTMFLSWTTQTGCRIHRTYVSLIGSGEGRHTTHLLKCVLLLSTSQTDWKQSSDVLSDISFDILSDKSSDISSDILSDISSDILSDIFLTYLLTFFLTNLLTLFLTYLLTFFLTYLSTCFLTYLLTFFLTYQNQNLTSTASHKKPLCKLYIYLTPRSKSNIHDNFVPVDVIALGASDRPAKRQLSPKMQNACSSTHTHTTCIRPPRQTAVESKNAKEFEVPQLHLMACANHEVRCSPLRFFRRICIGGPAPHVICLPLTHSILPKRGRSTKDCSALLQLLLALRIWNRPPFICHIPLVSLHDFFHDKHQIPSMCSARRLHAHVHALSTNTSQLVAPHMLNSFGHLIGSPNEDRLRTFHHNLRHGCQTKLTSLHKNKVEPTVLAAVCQIKQKTRCHPQDSVGANLNSCYPDLCTHIYLGHIFWHSAWHSFWLIFWHSSWHIFWHFSWHIFWHIFWHSFWHIFWHIFLTFLLTYLLTFILTYLLSFFLTYLSPFFLTYLLAFFLTYLFDISPDILPDISSDILSDISFDILSDLSSEILPDISCTILSDISFDILSDISSDILSDISSDITFDIHSDISSDISFWHFFWHIFCHSFWHIFCHSFWQNFWHNTWGPARHTELTGSRHLATTSLTHSFCNYRWGPARHTELAKSQVGSDTPHCTRRIAVGVQHATLTSPRLGSSTPHWTHRIADGVQHATLNSQDRSWGGRQEEEEDEEGGEGREGGEETDIKSNNPHLTGGEKWFWICWSVCRCVQRSFAQSATFLNDIFMPVPHRWRDLSSFEKTSEIWLNWPWAAGQPRCPVLNIGRAARNLQRSSWGTVSNLILLQQSFYISESHNMPELRIVVGLSQPPDMVTDGSSSSSRSGK